MKTTAMLLAALVLGAGLGAAGCGGRDHDRKGPGVVEEKTPQPTTGTLGTQSPTPGRTTTSTTG